MPLAFGIILSAGAASQLVTRFGVKPPLIAGLLPFAAGQLWFSQLPGAGGSYAPDVLGPSLLAAAGLGFAFVPVHRRGYRHAAARRARLRTDQHLPAGWRRARAGLAILATIPNSHTQRLLRSGVHDVSVALTKGFDRAFLVGDGLAATRAILAALLISSRDSRDHSLAARSRDTAAVPVAAGSQV